MENNFRLAGLLDRDEVIRQISNYEKELSNRTGEDIVLIAYTRNNKH